MTEFFNTFGTDDADTMKECTVFVLVFILGAFDPIVREDGGREVPEEKDGVSDETTAAAETADKSLEVAGVFSFHGRVGSFNEGRDYGRGLVADRELLAGQLVEAVDDAVRAEEAVGAGVDAVELIEVGAGGHEVAEEMRSSDLEEHQRACEGHEVADGAMGGGSEASSAEKDQRKHGADGGDSGVVFGTEFEVVEPFFSAPVVALGIGRRGRLFRQQAIHRRTKEQGDGNGQ